LTDVALHCGFASSSDFSRSFRQHFGQAPRRFDLDAFRDTRRADFDRLLGAQYVPPQVQVLDNNANPDGFEARVRDLPARTVAYVRVFDPYREGAAEAAFRHLLAWAEQRGLADRQWLGYMWDEPEIVALADCRYDVALVVNEPVSDGDVGCFRFPAMRVAEVDIRGDIHLEVRATGSTKPGYLSSAMCRTTTRRSKRGSAALLPMATGIVYRTISGHLLTHAGLTRKTGHTGAVTLIQRFGCALNPNVHFRLIFVDGVSHRGLSRDVESIRNSIRWFSS
jgi:hypothetical protein